MVKILHLLLILVIGSASMVFSRVQSFAFVPESATTTPSEGMRQLMPLKDALKGLEKIHKVSIMFDSKLAENILVQTKEKPQNESIETALTNMLSPVNINYKKISEQFYVINFKDSKTSADHRQNSPRKKAVPNRHQQKTPIT